MRSSARVGQAETRRHRPTVRTDEVVVHGVLDVVLRDGVFSVDDLQLGPVLERVLLETQQVEDAPQRLRGHGEDTNKLSSHREW